MSQQLFDTFQESYLQLKLQKDMILRVSNRNRIKNQIQIFSKSFWWHITLNWSEIKPFFFTFYWKIFEAQSSGLWTDSERKNVQRRPMLVINRLKRRNPPCTAPLCVVSSFFPWEKRREGAQRKVDFFSSFCLHCIIPSCLRDLMLKDSISRFK